MSFLKKGIIILFTILIFITSSFPVLATTETPVKVTVDCPPSYVGQSQCFIIENPKKPKIVKEIVPPKTIKPTIGSGSPKNPVFYSLVLGGIVQMASTTETGQRVIEIGEEKVTEFDLALGQAVDEAIAFDNLEQQKMDEAYTGYLNQWSGTFGKNVDIGIDFMNRLKFLVDDAFGLYDFDLGTNYNMPSKTYTGAVMPPRDFVLSKVSTLRYFYTNVQVIGYVGGAFLKDPTKYRDHHAHVFVYTYVDSRDGSMHTKHVIISAHKDYPDTWVLNEGNISYGDGFLGAWNEYNAWFTNYISNRTVPRFNNFSRPFENQDDISHLPITNNGIVLPPFKSIPLTTGPSEVVIPSIVEDDTGKKYWEEQPLLQPEEVDTGKRYIPLTPTEVLPKDIESEKTIITEDGKAIYEDGSISPDPVIVPTQPPGENDVGSGTPCGCRLDNPRDFSLWQPWLLLLPFLDLLIAIGDYVLRLFMFIVTIPNIPSKPIPNEAFAWFRNSTFLGFPVYSIVTSFMSLTLSLSAYKIIRKLF